MEMEDRFVTFRMEKAKHIARRKKERNGGLV